MAVHMAFELSDSNRVRKTIVYDIVGKKIILAQTSPPLLRSHLGERVRISFVIKKKGIKNSLLAFSAEIKEYIPNYEMNSYQTVPAIVLHQITDLKEIERRMFYRITPPPNNDLEVMLGNEKMNVIDISLGGAKLSHSRECILEPYEQIQLTFRFDRRRFTIDAKVIREERKTYPITDKKTQTVFIQFERNDREFERFIALKIMTLERQHLSESKY